MGPLTHAHRNIFNGHYTIVQKNPRRNFILKNLIAEFLASFISYFSNLFLLFSSGFVYYFICLYLSHVFSFQLIFFLRLKLMFPDSYSTWVHSQLSAETSWDRHCAVPHIRVTEIRRKTGGGGGGRSEAFTDKNQTNERLFVCAQRERPPAEEAQVAVS